MEHGLSAVEQWNLEGAPFLTEDPQVRAAHLDKSPDVETYFQADDFQARMSRVINGTLQTYGIQDTKLLSRFLTELLGFDFECISPDEVRVTGTERFRAKFEQYRTEGLKRWRARLLLESRYSQA